MAETAAEKVLSLLRRCAISGTAAEGIRLILPWSDMITMSRELPNMPPTPSLLQRASLRNWSKTTGMDFAHQNPDFNADPISVLRRTLRSARANDVLREQYTTHLMPLVHDVNAPSFERSFAMFEAVALDFIDVC